MWRVMQGSEIESYYFTSTSIGSKDEGSKTKVCCAWMVVKLSLYGKNIPSVGVCHIGPLLQVEPWG